MFGNITLISEAFASTLGRLARPPEPEPPHYLDRVSEAGQQEKNP